MANRGQALETRARHTVMVYFLVVIRAKGAVTVARKEAIAAINA